MNLSIADKVRQLAVDELCRHAEAFRHGLQRAATHHPHTLFSPFETVQKLLVCAQPQNPDHEGSVRADVRVLLQNSLQLEKTLEELVVQALVERAEKALQNGHLQKGDLDVRHLHQVLLDGAARQAHDGRNHGVFDQVVERENGEGSEGGNCLRVQIGHFGEVLGNHGVHARVDLVMRRGKRSHVQAIAMIPIAGVFHHLLDRAQRVRVLLDVLVEQVGVEDEHPDVHLHVGRHLVIQALLVRAYGVLDISNLVVVVCLPMNDGSSLHKREQEVQDVVLAPVLLHFVNPVRLLLYHFVIHGLHLIE